MPNGSISSSADCVGVAVVNYKVPVCESKEDVIANCHRIADTIKGAKMGYPGLDLIIFPEDCEFQVKKIGREEVWLLHHPFVYESMLAPPSCSVIV